MRGLKHAAIHALALVVGCVVVFAVLAATLALLSVSSVHTGPTPHSVIAPAPR